MKKRLARMFRRYADRLDPAGRNPIIDMMVDWKRNELPHIHLELIGGHRLHGRVVPDNQYLEAMCRPVPFR